MIRKEPEIVTESDGKHSLVQLALEYFRRKPNERSGELCTEENWTWREQLTQVKYSKKVIGSSLLPLPRDLEQLAILNYKCLLSYAGDLNADQQKFIDVEAVYTILRVMWLCRVRYVYKSYHCPLEKIVYIVPARTTRSNLGFGRQFMFCPLELCIWLSA